MSGDKHEARGTEASERERQEFEEWLIQQRTVGGLKTAMWLSWQARGERDRGLVEVVNAYMQSHNGEILGKKYECGCALCLRAERALKDSVKHG